MTLQTEVPGAAPHNRDQHQLFSFLNINEMLERLALPLCQMMILTDKKRIAHRYKRCSRLLLLERRRYNATSLLDRSRDSKSRSHLTRRSFRTLSGREGASAARGRPPSKR